MSNYVNKFVTMQNRPFTNHVDYGLSRGFIVSPTEYFPFTCAPHRQEIRTVTEKQIKFDGRPVVQLIEILPGALNQPITMPSPY